MLGKYALFMKALNFQRKKIMRLGNKPFFMKAPMLDTTIHEEPFWIISNRLADKEVITISHGSGAAVASVLHDS